MSRRRRAEKRPVIPDPKFNNVLVALFINGIMRRGKKGTAERILYRAIDIAGDKLKTDGISVLKKAINNVKPTVEVKSRRIGGANYQIPIEVPPDRRMALCIRWLSEAAWERKEKSMAEKLGLEIAAASNNEGIAIKKKEDTHRMAEANKAFAHFRWR
ncbi:MAG: 30S ribosomal protein S7 [Candidatus Raymondbacteria bacterium RifOxyA12_full_50_37]|uniref:Small ribosomal subunit protein uS7 n=1 Tax=Candidatus Raymondbacteria bacterium RIFOXYD12_FULL_49_13 TaxID=1817890 RepID=A0A1F7FD53_UNCRA|nr:MAG: 30S ribosomal protein S7 [Candidatus Raymondbacteria bacterium RifOxyA12_full_50_37]OGJ94052.1 MAG: 30S ribosomal protein S7 [Candidatus Raymondbacteria bacterium RIFOXYA2_FULL_49_16]OGJ96877.1 MAG: 30S ribosomal protein S7 [Candidatus Raymondbacteria bacterium RIFOXYC2_FULL_50_21]OGJ97496.1 MAG: 30S ribosomal protein S7 [Candidatus Raymondbacteria bacterium RifOxyC12_full_50_8]OGK00946.1 MAG: 30S ribosomal protein S7 [Candidatus Raymondbacteria bacterium RifOxyB12_full_50_8]OGK04604.1